VAQQAPRIDRRLIRSLGRLDDPSRPIADTYRQAGELAARLGLVRPSYEQIRVLVHEERRRKEERAEPRRVIKEVATGRTDPRALLDPGGAD
jgi:hypothetical protein